MMTCKRLIVLDRVSEKRGDDTAVFRALHQLICETTKRLIALALEEELHEFLRAHDHLRLADGLTRAVVRNGYLPARTIQTTAGKIPVQVPRARDRSNAGIVFTSTLLPRYHSRSRYNDLLPEAWLRAYLEGDARALLRVVLGAQVDQVAEPILAAVERQWSRQVLEWRQRSLGDSAWLAWWAGTLKSAPLWSNEAELLFIVGMDQSGRHELVAIAEVASNSENAWLELFQGLRQRQLSKGPALVEAEASPGFWRALAVLYPETAAALQQEASEEPRLARLSLAESRR